MLLVLSMLAVAGPVTALDGPIVPGKVTFPNRAPSLAAAAASTSPVDLRGPRTLAWTGLATSLVGIPVAIGSLAAYAENHDHYAGVASVTSLLVPMGTVMLAEGRMEMARRVGARTTAGRVGEVLGLSSYVTWVAFLVAEESGTPIGARLGMLGGVVVMQSAAWISASVQRGQVGRARKSNRAVVRWMPSLGSVVRGARGPRIAFVVRW